MVLGLSLLFVLDVTTVMAEGGRVSKTELLATEELLFRNSVVCQAFRRG
jgi:hypothetical protein